MQSGAVVIPLSLHRLERPAHGDAAACVPEATRSHVVGFFSLAGGSGRTTLAVEAATLLAVRGRAAAAARSQGVRVVLLDLARRNPAVGLRLGMPPPAVAGGELVAHSSGLLVALASATALPSNSHDGAQSSAVIDGPACAGADIVVVDFDGDLGEPCMTVLQRCDQVLVTVTASAVGIIDAYRSTAVLRRLGLRDRVEYVVNRWREEVATDEILGDLGGVIAAEIPDHPALVEAEDAHQPAGLYGDGAVAAALGRLATRIEEAAGIVPSAAGLPRWGSHAG